MKQPNYKITDRSIKIDPNTTDIKNTDKKEISDYNLQEIRGWIIDELNIIEGKIDFIITVFFNPEKKIEFRQIVLNSSVLNTGAKMKILKNIDSFTTTSISKIQKIISIRNAFAHIPVTKSTTITIRNIAGELKFELDSVVTQLAVMNSSGEIKTRNVKDLVEEFTALKNDINLFLDDILTKHETNS